MNPEVSHTPKDKAPNESVPDWSGVDWESMTDRELLVTIAKSTLRTSNNIAFFFWIQVISAGVVVLYLLISSANS